MSKLRAVLLICLGLGAFASPAAAQWNGLPFNAPVFAQNGITMGNGITDSYNSDLGPYNPATAGSNGDLATNANISLAGTVVRGDATAVGTISGGTVTGTRTQNAPPFPSMPILPCPTGGYSILPTPFPSGVSYNAGSGDLVVGGGHTYTLNVPPSQYYFHSVSLTGGSTLTFNNPSGTKVDIFLADGLTIGGGGVGNTSGLPTRLGFWACGSPASPTKWDLSGGSIGYFSLYAPNHLVRVGGSGGQIFGAVVAATFDASSNASFHFDEALLNETLPSYGIEVSPQAATASRLPSNGSNYTATFTVQNTSDVLDGYDLLTRKVPGTALTTVSITGSGVTQGANPDSARRGSLAAGATATVTVTYSASSVAVGTIDTLIFTARSVASPTTSANGRVTVTVVRPSLTIAKAVNPSGTQPPGTALSYTMTVANGGTSSAAGVALVDTLAPAVQLKVGSVATTLPSGVTAVVEYSNDAGATWTYVPVIGGCGAPAGYDACVNRIRWQLQNTLGYTVPNNSGALEFVAQIR
ncbi:MAG TPA: hypothetical protein VEK78_16660 [Gemmatimonadales bacterium]|nr:hypothetical protein [Gemmatimonadales bacterium]